MTYHSGLISMLNKCELKLSISEYHSIRRFVLMRADLI